MGGDGGSIQGRDVLVKVKQPERVVVNQHQILEQRINTCSISGRPLLRPVVACELGYIYNKDALIEHLLDKSKDIPAFRHVRGLKDVIECKIRFDSDQPASNTAVEVSSRVTTTNGSAGTGELRATREGDTVSTNINRIVCPITDSRATGSLPFIVMRGCGCVMSLKGYRDMTKNDASLCPVCEQPIPQLDNTPPAPATTSMDATLSPSSSDAAATVETKSRESADPSNPVESTRSSESSIWVAELPYIILCSGDVAIQDQLRSIMLRKRAAAKAAKQDRKRARGKTTEDDAGAKTTTKRVEVDPKLASSAESLRYAQYIEEAERIVNDQKAQSSAIASIFTSSSR